MRKRRVLIVAGNNLAKGGIQAVIMSIVRNLHGKFDFDIVCFDSRKSYYEDEFQAFGGNIWRIPFYEGKNRIIQRADFYTRGIYLYWKIYSILKQNRYDVIHCHNSLESGLCLAAAKKANIKVRITHAHTSFDDENSCNFVRKKYIKFYRKIMLKNATKLIGCSATANLALYKLSYAEVVYNTIEFSEFDQKKHKRRKHDDIVLLQVAQYSDNKNQIFTLRILKELKKYMSNAKLVLVGRYLPGESEAYFNKIEEYLLQEKLLDSVEFKPADSCIPQIMEFCDYFIFPSKKEGLGIAPIEAQAMGMTCFVSDTVPQEIDCGGCKWLSLQDDPKMWAKAIYNDYLLHHGERIKCDMSKFETDKIMKQYVGLYNN